MSNREIVICPNCKGSGVIECRELEDYHKNIYDEWTEVCTNCNGHGRLRKVVTVKYEKLTDKELKATPRGKN
jgi:DnaJ-class molecular chaperone